MQITGTLYCAKCHKPVDRIEASIDPLSGGYAYTAFCHGETDSCVLLPAEMVGATGIQFDEAFKG